MKRVTHIMIGAAVAMPIAAPLSPALALGAVWWGMVGGGFPDWLDLRSEFRRTMKHRGLSHSLAAAAMLSLGFWALLRFTVPELSGIGLGASSLTVWALSFAAGYVSHIAADACTHAGVRPWLPFSKTTWWILPGFLRGTSSGGIDLIARVIALIGILAGIIGYLTPGLLR